MGRSKSSSTRAIYSNSSSPQERRKISNNTLLNNQEITGEIKEEIKKYLEANDNENTTTQNLWNTAKVVLRGKFIVINAYIKKKKELK